MNQAQRMRSVASLIGRRGSDVVLADGTTAKAVHEALSTTEVEAFFQEGATEAGGNVADFDPCKFTFGLPRTAPVRGDQITFNGAAYLVARASVDDADLVYIAICFRADAPAAASLAQPGESGAGVRKLYYPPPAGA